ncbi:HAMP domain-containing sensor histidine kinase [soil metagenome]
MFKFAQIKLTIFYSILFLMLFWIFSGGLYIWMDNSFGEGYISQIQQRQGQDQDTISKNTKVVTIAGDAAIDELRNILFILNGVLLFIIPIVSWFLAKHTLSPLQIAHEQQKQFVSDASHEMRTPLSIMSGEIEVALNKKRSSEDYQKILKSIKEETDRLSRLVENLLFLARNDQNMQIPFQSIDVTDLMNEVVHSLRIKSKAKQISVSLKGDSVSSPMVSGNPDLLRQLFFNLLDNAIIYTQNKGKITITLSENDKHIFIALQDTGIGISGQDQSKIMKRFYRADTSRSQTKGYGLGLSIVQTILEKHYGYLTIDSQLKKGSTFTVLLPKV